MAIRNAGYRRSPSLGSGKAQAASTPFRGLRTTNPQSNFRSRITLGRSVGPGGTGGARTSNAPVQANAVAGDGTVALSWAAPTETGGADVIAYDIYRGTTSGTGTLLASVNADTLTYDDDSAVNGTTYFYRIKAKSSVGDSAFSNEKSATPSA